VECGLDDWIQLAQDGDLEERGLVNTNQLLAFINDTEFIECYTPTKALSIQ